MAMTQQEIQAFITLQAGLNDRDATIADLQKKLQAEQQAHAVAKQQLDEWRKKCETMGNHPDVRAAALKKAEANLKAAQEQVSRLKGS